MNRRSYLAAVGTAVAGVLGYGALRTGDLRPYDPTLPSGETPRERIVAAAAHCYAADHRAVSRIRVTRDSAGESGYELGRVCERHQHSRRRHLYVYRTDRFPPRPVPHPFWTLLGLFHWEIPGDTAAPVSSIVYTTDGEQLWNWEAPAPADVTTTPELGSEARYSQSDPEFTPVVTDHVRPHGATWTRVPDGDSPDTYEITSLDGYAEVVTLPTGIERLVPGCRVRVGLDEAGRLARIVDDLVVRVSDTWADNSSVDQEPAPGTGQPRTIGYRRVTELDNYGTATAPRPTGDVDVGLSEWLQGTLSDLQTY